MIYSVLKKLAKRTASSCNQALEEEDKSAQCRCYYTNIQNLLRTKQVLFDSGENENKPSKKFFKHHILEKDKHKRFEFATETPNILNHPDEIWNNKLDQNSTVYLKFYETGTLKLVVIDGKAKTLYKLFEEDGKLNEARKGILIYK